MEEATQMGGLSAEEGQELTYLGQNPLAAVRTDCKGGAGIPVRRLFRQEVMVTWTREPAAGVVRSSWTLDIFCRWQRMGMDLGGWV